MSINKYKRQRTHSSTDDGNLSQLEEENNTEDWPHRALLNHVIIMCIFENLDEDDFRNCRLVCQKWKSVGECSFKKKVQLCFRFEEEDDEESGDEVQDDKEAKFTAPTDLVEFFQMSQNEVPFLDSYDLTPILSGIENLKTLTLIRAYGWLNTTTRWIVSLKNLENIQHFDAEACSIELKTNPLIISPIYLRLREVTFLRDNKDLKNIHLNEFVNFGTMESLFLSIYRVTTTKISLDVAGNAVLKQAEFYHVDLVNFEESGWIVDELKCSFSPFDKPTKIIVRQLEITDCDCVFKMLPNSLQKLSVREYVHIVENTEPTLWNISFLHLKRLELTNIDVIEDGLPYLTSYCYNLKELDLRSRFLHVKEVMTINLDMIPRTVKHLTLRGEYDFVGEGVHALDELRMREFSSCMSSVLPTLRVFEPKTFSLWLPYLKPSDSVVKALFETSIPKVNLSYFSYEAFIYLKENYTFEENNEEVVIVNGKGSTITIIVDNCSQYK